MLKVLCTFTAASLTLLLAATSGAQGQAANPLSESTRRMFTPVRDNIAASADLVKDADFEFRPATSVRTFGQLVGHIANAEFTICAASLGRANPHPADVEAAGHNPATLRRLLRESFALCTEAYASLTDAALTESMSFFGGQQARHFALTYNIVHANEHYGNMVTYMRMRGLVPPSSAPR